MTDRDETFLGRWSRVKRNAAREAIEPTAGPDAVVKAESVPGAPDAEFDISSLPSVESITAGTDVRDFLRAGVPPELTKAALRQVWTSDPSIRDFIGIAENQWDFTDPTSIPGFGPMAPTDNVAELVAQAMGRLEVRSKPADAASPSDVGVIASGDASAIEQPGNSTELSSTCAESSVSAASQHEVEPIAQPRRHGGAMPS